jgi:hypothetical protein
MKIRRGTLIPAALTTAVQPANITKPCLEYLWQMWSDPIPIVTHGTVSDVPRLKLELTAIWPSNRIVVSFSKRLKHQNAYLPVAGIWLFSKTV